MSEAAGDRSALYHHLHGNQLQEERNMNAYSAERFLKIALSYFEIKTMLDIGCGIGTWLNVAQQMGIEISGVEGPWSEADKLEIDPSKVTITDLEQPVDVGRKFDLAISLEVGEHLSADAAPHLVKSLVSHADHVIFSAAIPFQGGHHHVNEQFLSYWINLFAEHGYRPIDIFRGPLWNDAGVLWWLKQNAVLFASRSAIDTTPKLKAETLVDRPIDFISPDVYMDRIVPLREQLFHIQQTLLHTGKARVRETPEGPIFEIV